MSSPELKQYQMAGTAPMKVHRLAPHPLTNAAPPPSPSPSPEEQLRAEIRAAVKRQMSAIIREVLDETADEREVRTELATAGTVALNARAAACYRRLVKQGMDSMKAGQLVLRVVQEKTR